MSEAPGEIETNAPAETAPAFDRTISPISGRLGPNMAGKAVVMVALAAGCGVFLAATGLGDRPKAERRAPEPARQVVPFEPAKPAAPPTLDQPGPDAPRLSDADSSGRVPALQPDPATAPDPAAQRRAELAALRGAPLIAYSRSGASGASAEIAAPPPPPATPAATELDQLRQGSAIGHVRATRLTDRNFLIVAGATIPCLLQTAMDTATPGYVSCVVPRDVMSDNGAVVLLAKGARVLGEYRSSLRQGQRRLFVLWTRVVTPDGVAIALASPAADALGRAGFDGEIDTHFWDRFGGAFLLSIVDDGAYAAAGNGAGSNVARVPSDAAAVALQNSINIPPSLRKAQGAEVSIFVAQDCDFSGVYGLKAH